MNRTRISIVIPTYNAGLIVARCLDSIAGQSLRGIEVLVVDGGSTDDTLAIVGGYAGRFDRFRLVSEPDRGIYDAMNKGVALANGDWIYFTGADDRLSEPDILRKVAGHLTADVDFLYGNVFRVARQRVEGERFDRDKLFGQNICQQGIFYRRQMLNRVGRYNLDYRVCADWDLNIRCFASGCRSRYVDLTISDYDGGGLSSHTTDHAFHERKLGEIARLYKASYWSAVFRSRRYDFFERAMLRLDKRRMVAALYYFGLYCYHGVFARFAGRSQAPSG